MIGMSRLLGKLARCDVMSFSSQPLDLLVHLICSSCLVDVVLLCSPWWRLVWLRRHARPTLRTPLL